MAVAAAFLPPAVRAADGRWLQVGRSAAVHDEEGTWRDAVPAPERVAASLCSLMRPRCFLHRECVSPLSLLMRATVGGASLAT